ncbi:MAG: ROK family transcriptional regulator [Phyllobacterium sp.]
MLMIENRQFTDAHQRDCARVIAALHAANNQPRAQLAVSLDMTSTATSRIIADLIERGIVTESAGEKSGRGRPATRIGLNPYCAGATILHISSQQLTGVLIDFKGHILAQETLHVSSATDGDGMAQTMRGLVSKLVACCPQGMVHVGTSVTVTGIVDVRDGIWILTSRWPNIRDFNVTAALSGVTPVTRLFRQLDVELNARFDADDSPCDSAAILHWGWGVGLSYRSKSNPALFQEGPFGEIGHWRFNILEDRPCGCGNHGCLETAVSLSAVLPVIRQRYPDIAEDEEQAARQIAQMELTDLPEIRMAIRLVARALGNVCRILFPQKVFITGPFIANAPLCALLQSDFEAEGLVGRLHLPALVPDRSSVDYIIKGASRPLFELALDRLLDIEND